MTSFLAVLICSTVFAQLQRTVKCPDFDIDILDGKVNANIIPQSTNGQIMEEFPCFSNEEKKGTTAKSGAGVFYKDRDVYFYTDRHYVEIGPAFKGKMSIKLLGVERNSLFKVLGAPEVKDVNWDAFQTSYGILILYYDKSSKVDKIQFSSENANTIHLYQ
ncbi:MAG TPA: hypothetical protein VIJ75_06115 [Hanamia sp.]